VVLLRGTESRAAQAGLSEYDVPRVLLLATTTGYQVRAFGEAAERLGVELVFATDRCHQIDDPWRDQAIPIRFFDEAGSAAAILERSQHQAIDGVIVVGDRPTVIAARVLEAIGLLGHPVDAAAIARNKLLFRRRLRDWHLPVPSFRHVVLSTDPDSAAEGVGYPCVVKPLALSGSRGVMRANNRPELVAAMYRIRALLQSPDVRAERDEAHDAVLIEDFIDGREFALEGVMEQGELRVLALFDKPDPLDGPFFEETIYVTPSALAAETQQQIVDAIRSAASAVGLRHGPVHAEVRVNERGVFVLEVAARPIGGLCARALRFEGVGSRHLTISFEELLLRHALGQPVNRWAREPYASGVMMIPIAQRGVLRRVAGLEEARRVPHIEDVRITAKADQVLVPLPEGASYLGFIFSRAAAPGDVERALRAAHRALRFTIAPEVRVLQSRHG
jgi:formate-dependent phosphoribosylglycinamide formyltransferase (GAR transformylase)